MHSLLSDTTRLRRLLLIAILGLIAWAMVGPLHLAGDYHSFIIVAISYTTVITMSVSMLAGTVVGAAFVIAVPELARGYERHSPSGGDGRVTGSRVVGAVCRHRGDRLLRRDLVAQVRQDRGVTDGTEGNLERKEVQWLFIYGDVDFMPDTAFGAAILAAPPLTFSLFCRRLNVLKSGTDQVSAQSFKRLSMTPVDCLKGSLNNPVRVRQA